jgi:DNA mismatch repair protein MSH2
VIVGFAVASVVAPVPYVKPEIVERDQGVLQLQEARHPCLEQVKDVSVFSR